MTTPAILTDKAVSLLDVSSYHMVGMQASKQAAWNFVHQSNRKFL